MPHHFVCWSLTKHMKHCYIPLAILFCHVVLFGTVQSKLCADQVKEATWNFLEERDVEKSGVDSPETCFQLCEEDSLCKGYTWRTDDIKSWCFMFKQLDNIHACSGCHSGTFPEVVNGACSEGFEDIIHEASTESAEKCADLCYWQAGCHAYTWYDKSTQFPNFCFMYSSCNNEIPCTGCVSENLNCIQAPECYQYNILDESNRNIMVEISEDSDWGFADALKLIYTSPRWHDNGYYRIMEPAGHVIPTRFPGRYHCGTANPGWINDKDGVLDNLQVGQKEEVELSFCTSPDDECYSHFDITVTRCPGDYYVYQLWDLANKGHARYCAAMYPGYPKEN